MKLFNLVDLVRSLGFCVFWTECVINQGKTRFLSLISLLMSNIYDAVAKKMTMVIMSHISPTNIVSTFIFSRASFQSASKWQKERSCNAKSPIMESRINHRSRQHKGNFVSIKRHNKNITSCRIIAAVNRIITLTYNTDSISSTLSRTWI